DFALGHAGLADSYIALTFYNFAAPHETMPKAKESAIKALALDDPLAEAHASLAHILMNYDWNWAAAEKEFKRSIELKQDYAKSQKKHEANEMLNELSELSKQQYVSAYEVATIYVALGNNEQAFQLLEQAYGEHSFHLVYLNVSPQFKPVSSDPRFQDLVQRI